MEKTPESYHISFFKPTTDRARSNRNMVLWLVSIWFISVFGFHILLRIIEKPVPEPAYTAFENVWDDISQEKYGAAELQEFGKSCLSVVGKINVTAEEKQALDNAISWTVYQLTPEEDREGLINTVVEFEEISKSISDIKDEQYISVKHKLSEDLSNTLGLSDFDVRKIMIPFALNSGSMKRINQQTNSTLPDIMSRYLIHNQSALTDARFLGFPFHYFYTAVFLLILFVGLCWIYCVRTDAMNKKLEIAD